MRITDVNRLGTVDGVERQQRLLPAPDFGLAVQRLANGTRVVVLAGELDLYRAPEIEEALAQAIEPPRDGDERRGRCGALSADRGRNAHYEPRCLIVDLREVSFLDSTTLAILLAASRRERARGNEFVVLVGPRTPTTVFEVTGFDRLLTIRRSDADPDVEPT